MRYAVAPRGARDGRGARKCIGVTAPRDAKQAPQQALPVLEHPQVVQALVGCHHVVLRRRDHLPVTQILPLLHAVGEGVEDSHGQVGRVVGPAEVERPGEQVPQRHPVVKRIGGGHKHPVVQVVEQDGPAEADEPQRHHQQQNHSEHRAPLPPMPLLLLHNLAPRGTEEGPGVE